MAYQAIENCGIIGNRRTVGLVGMNGSIDWYCYPKTKTNMFVVARKITRRMFGVDLGVVVPAWSAGTQVHTDVSGGVPAAWMPAVRAGMTEALR